MIEVWKDIKGFEHRYQVSNFGRIRSLGRYNRNKKWMSTSSENNWHAWNVLDSIERRNTMRNILISNLTPERRSAISESNRKRKGVLSKGEIKCSNGVIYFSASEACRVLNLHPGNLSEILNKKRKTTKGLKFEYYKEKELK